MREHNILILILRSCCELQTPDLYEELKLPVFFLLLVCKDS